MIMWSAVILRILENGSTRSPGQGSTVGWTTGPVDGTGDGGRGTGAVAGALAPVSMKPRMSCLVTRPANPVPGMVEMSSWCSAAILRTSGVDLRRNRSSADRKSTRLNSSHGYISYAVFCLKKKKTRLKSSSGNISYAVHCNKQQDSMPKVMMDGVHYPHSENTHDHSLRTNSTARIYPHLPP